MKFSMPIDARMFLDLTPAISLLTELLIIFATPSPKPCAYMIMANIPRYAGWGEGAQEAYFRNMRATYQSMLRDSQQHQIEGIGVWKFLNLLEGILGGEAYEVHNAFLDV